MRFSPQSKRTKAGNGVPSVEEYKKVENRLGLSGGSARGRHYGCMPRDTGTVD
jgi:hypothetical protein